MRKILMILAALLIWVSAPAQTPVEELIVRYGEVNGARDFVAKGTRMILVRGLLSNYGLGAIEDDVEELYVLKLANTSELTKKEFLADLKTVLVTYEHYGMVDGKNGLVDVYVRKSGPESVSELVVYNPAIYTLNSLGGTFSVSSLLSLVRKEQPKDTSE